MKINEKGIYTVIFLTALFLRLIFLLNHDRALGGDEVAYNQLASALLNEHRFSADEEYSHPPAYPFFISIAYFIFGQSARAVRIIQALLDSGLCVLIYWLSNKLFNRRTALIAALFSASYLLFIKAASCLLTESVFTFVLFLMIIYIWKSKERFSYFNAAILGLLITVLVLIKGIMLLFLPFLLIAAAVTRYYRFINFADFAKRTALMIAVFILTMSVWVYRNYRVYNAFVPVSTQTGWAFYDSYFPRDGKIFGVNAFDDNVRYGLSLKSQTKMSNYLAKKAVEFIKKNPLKVLRLEFLKILYFWCPFDWELMGKEKGIYNFQYVFMLPFSMLGVILLMKNLNKYVVLYVPVVYLFLMSLLFYGSPRFRMPVEPYLIIFFAVGVVRFFRLFKYIYIPAGATLLYALINFKIYLNSDTVKECIRGCLISVGLWC